MSDAKPAPPQSQTTGDAPSPTSSSGATASPSVMAAASEGEPDLASASASGSGSGAEMKSQSQGEKEEVLPPLTPAEFKVYNRLAVQMEYFHNHFMEMWKTIYTACTNNRRPSHLSLRQFIDEGLRLTHYLEAHHNIEETYLYPILARKMPQFRAKKGASNKECELLKQHKEIHRGMDVYTAYLTACKNRKTELELGVLKEKMDSWGDVLHKHLDDEVKELEADVMRRFWTLDEMKAIPI